MSSSINNVYKNTGTCAISSEEEDTSLHISKETYDAFFKEYVESLHTSDEYDEDDEEAAEDRIAIEDEEREEEDTVPSYIVEIQHQMSKEYRAWISMGLTQEDLDAYRQCLACINELQAYYLSPSQYNSNKPLHLLQDIVTYNECYDEKRREALARFALQVEEEDKEDCRLEEFNSEIEEYSEEETEEERREWEEWVRYSNEADRERSWREDQRDNY